ncbi:processive 1,2-diacylglycerol beta-glucosyltransferase [Sphaerochaeta associata]|uniref:UDP-N-acetylglucosamine--LPS N-acetylglucosamine transferase n=1 Tax=Sphaerochaeta associata TaxID=1129264 RepID=A0ABY4DD48_9SPIR|nr:UDP-N-acetylglucosamine--LPS N-acetylglucosamine transferase [Sphaerochaeta associata]UOM52178.1 UDP-N-acetylglucosamine--LPS N-acetylglucosamine transferase [Sphaerochaeta associata]SMP46295.1 processive 1,2-diacylglycerol beta-glucosyltransferase [Sphaerochaeta associata]
MHIALLYVDAGKGHITPARALSDAFQRLGHTTVVENLFATVGAPMINWISKYNWRLQLHFPKMEAKVNARNDSAANAKRVRYVATHSHAVKDFQDWYEQVKPDLIVVPHFLAASIIQPLVDLLQLQVPVFEYAADVVFTPNLGINKHLDRLYICTEIGRELAIRAGQPEHTIRICPFPLKTELMQSKPLSKQDARKKLGLDDCFTVLLNLGGEGIGTTDFLDEVVERNLNWQIITVGELSGSTKLHYKAFKENHPDFPLHTPGFVKNIQDYICACDVQAGKAGANALMESLFLQRPFLISSLLYAAWPTTIFFNRRNVGWVENDVTRQVDILQAYSEDPIQQEAMLQAFAKLPLVFDSDAFARQILDDAAEVRKTKFGIASV